MRQRESDPIFPLIGRVYDAALDSSLWPQVLGEILGHVGASRGLLGTTMHSEAQGGFFFTHRIPGTFMEQYSTRYIQHDVWVQAGVKTSQYAEGNVLTDGDLVPHGEFLSSVFYRDFLAPMDIARLCCGIVFGANAAGAMPMVLSAYRGLKEAPFGERERAAYRILVPHLSRAFGILFRLRDAELKVAASRAALDRLNAGVVLIGPRRAVAFANRAARSMLAEEDGLRLRATSRGTSQLDAESAHTQLALAAALDASLDPQALEVSHFSQVVRIDRPSGRAAYTLNVSALPAQNEFGSGAERPLAIAFLNDPAEPLELDAVLLEKLYGLTPAECRLAQAMCSADSLPAIAARLGVSENTLKSQLQSIYGKTGTHRQAGLVKLFHGLAATRD